jgi:hypothetical protein
VSWRPRADRRQGILPFVLTLGEREDVTARAGLPLVVETSRALRLDEARDFFAASAHGDLNRPARNPGR